MKRRLDTKDTRISIIDTYRKLQAYMRAGVSSGCGLHEAKTKDKVSVTKINMQHKAMQLRSDDIGWHERMDCVLIVRLCRN